MAVDDNLIQSIKTWLTTCPYLAELGGDISVDFMEAQAMEGGIYPSGQQRLGEDMCGNVRWQYNGIFQISKLTNEDMYRMENQGLMESIHQWLNSFDRAGIPLPSGYYFEHLQAGNGFLAMLTEDGKFGVYQIQINLTYERMI